MDCQRCGHARDSHLLDSVCRVVLSELPSCLDCREALENLTEEQADRIVELAESLAEEEKSPSSKKPRTPQH